MYIPPQFTTSYADRASYPCSLVDKSTHDEQVRLYQDRLNDQSSRLCCDGTGIINVGFRDFYNNRVQCDKLNIVNDIELADRLGDHSGLLPPGNAVTKRDPACRFVFLTAENGRSCLLLTQQMLLRILTYHQVSAEYLDFLFLFGDREVASDLKFGYFWHRPCFGIPAPGMAIPDLGRSGRHYEMCYNLRGVESTMGSGASPLDQWSIRHGAIYHKFDIGLGTTMWIVTKAQLQLKDRIKNATNDNLPIAGTKDFRDAASSFRSSLEIHLLLARWSAENWWSYLQCLESLLTQKINDALLPNADHKHMPLNSTTLYTRNHLQCVLSFEEKAMEAAIILETNISILLSIRTFYEGLKSQDAFPLYSDASVVQAINTLNAQFQTLEQNFETKRARALYLAQHAKNRKDLILNLMQAQGSDNMSDMTKRSIEEALIMRVITVVTVIFLPATFVSTLFSTDIVKYQPGNDGVPGYHTQYSGLAMTRWLQVALPLTALTLTVAGFAFVMARRPLRAELRTWA